MGGRVKRRWPRIGSLVLVSWDDACHSAKAGSREVTEAWEPFIVETCGWLFRRTSRSIYIGHERLPKGAADSHRGITRIPIRMVEAIDTIAGPV